MFSRALRLAAVGCVVAITQYPVAAAATVLPGAAIVPPGAAIVPPGAAIPATGTPAAVHDVGQAAQSAARAFWTASRMATATPATSATSGGRIGAADPPPGTPHASPFGGVPTVGPLFYTTGTARHFCTASVVDSTTGNLVITAAHCVYSHGYAGHVEFVPGYRNGTEPYGVWTVKAIVVASGWRQSHDPDLDFAFLSVAAPGGRPIQRVTGGLQLGINRGYDHSIRVIGYNDSANEPVRCTTSSFMFTAGQMEFYCGGYWAGTSGGPWVIGYDGGKGTGTVFGVIGGYEAGGSYDWASYSAFLGSSASQLFRQAEAIAVAPAASR